MAVCSILYQLATRPEEQEKIHSELMRIAPDSKIPLTTKDLDRAHYMKAFIKEVFRYNKIYLTSENRPSI
jgi:cytochrome P450